MTDSNETSVPGGDVGMTAETGRTNRHTGWTFVLALAGVLAFATALRLYGLGEPDFWLDELHSMANSAARRGEFESPGYRTILEFSRGTTDLTPDSNWSAVWRGMRNDSHPPTYFLLLQSWRKLVGDGEFAVRLLPMIFSILSLVPFALILREYRRPMVGIAGAALLAMTFCHIRFAQDNRPYSLALLLLVISYWTFVKMQLGWEGHTRRERIVWVAVYCMATYLSVMTHYFTGAVLAGQAVLITAPGARPFRRAWIIAVAATFLTFVLTWGQQLVGQWEFIANQEWLYDRRPTHALHTLLHMADLPARMLFWHRPAAPHYAASLGGAVLWAAALLAMGRRGDRAAKLFAVWYLLPVLLFAVIDLTTQMRLLSELRYLSIAAPGFVGMIVLAAARLRGRRGWIAIGAAVLVSAFTLHLPTPWNPRGRRAAKYIAAQWQPGDLLVFDGTDWPPYWARHTYQIAAYYLSELTTIDPPVALISEPPDADFQKAMAAFDRLIVVSPRIGESCNPVPDTFRHIDKTGNVLLMGEIHLFDRLPAGQPP
ncbi:MAG: glycosyltransferase family 39 protein [Planctomycetes bacterium]|nr:glycosyltransferase family 39 protein [Planctomycetota bacterium]